MDLALRIRQFPVVFAERLKHRLATNPSTAPRPCAESLPVAGNSARNTGISLPRTKQEQQKLEKWRRAAEVAH